MPNLSAIPFSRPVHLKGQNELVVQSLGGDHMSGDGPFSKNCEQQLSKRLGSTVKLVSSATHALDMMGLLSEVSANDEVICPSFTFVSTANAFALRGAQIKFADCDASGNITFKEIERLTTSKTKAVVTMNYAGGSPDYDPILEFCRSKNIMIYEDAAQSIGATYKGRALGTFGDLGCFSFHETKNINCGEGGALIINNKKFHSRAEIIREKGTNRSQFMQGLVDKYSWVDIGSSFLMPDMAAAYLLPQIEQLELINTKRGNDWHTYLSELGPLISKVGGEFIAPPTYNHTNHHIFAFLLPKAEQRPDFIKHMRALGVTTPFHYISLHNSPFGRKHYPTSQSLPMTEKLSDRLVRLPLYHSLTASDLSRVIDGVKKFF